MRIACIVMIVLLGCRETERLSDAAAAASAALREERRTGEELGHTMKRVAGTRDASQIETQILPALQRYVAALELAIKKSDEVQAIHPDPKVDSQLAVYRQRVAAYRAARDDLAALRGKPDEMARELPTIAARLLAAP